MNKNKPARLPGAIAVVFLASVIFNSPCAGQSASPKSSSSGVDAAERNAEKNLAAATANPLQLRHFLLGMSKGADLHYLSGGVYAETMLQEAAGAGMCMQVKDSSLIECPPESVRKKLNRASATNRGSRTRSFQHRLFSASNLSTIR